MDQITDEERRRIAELVAEGAPPWKLHQEINRSRHAIRPGAADAPASTTHVRAGRAVLPVSAGPCRRLSRTAAVTATADFSYRHDG